MSGLTDSLGQIESGQEIHHSGSGWVEGIVVMKLKSPRMMQEPCRELQCSILRLFTVCVEPACLLLRLGGGR